MASFGKDVYYLNRLQRSKHLQKYSFHNKYLIALDGTQYHCSEDIKCSECLQKEKKNGVMGETFF